MLHMLNLVFYPLVHFFLGIIYLYDFWWRMFSKIYHCMLIFQKYSMMSARCVWYFSISVIRRQTKWNYHIFSVGPGKSVFSGVQIHFPFADEWYNSLCLFSGNLPKLQHSLNIRRVQKHLEIAFFSIWINHQISLFTCVYIHCAVWCFNFLQGPQSASRSIFTSPIILHVWHLISSWPLIPKLSPSLRIWCHLKFKFLGPSAQPRSCHMGNRPPLAWQCSACTTGPTVILLLVYFPCVVRFNLIYGLL